MDPSSPDRFRAFAACVAHDLRTPLSALSGEVELALRRERSPAAYRAALVRISEGVKELVDLTGDLAFLGGVSSSGEFGSRTARLDAAFAALADRYIETAPLCLSFDVATPPLTVIGDETLLTRGLTLLVEHAVRYRRTRTPVCLHVAANHTDQRGASIDLVLDAAPPEFSPHAWQHLAEDGRQRGSVDAPGLLRLQTAARIVEECGGSLSVRVAAGCASVHIRLQKAPSENGES